MMEASHVHVVARRTASHKDHLPITSSPTEYPTTKLKTASLLLLTFQGAAQPLLARYSRTRHVDAMYMFSSLVFVTEIVKLLVGLSIIAIQRRSIRKCAQQVYEALFLESTETIKTCGVEFTLDSSLANSRWFFGIDPNEYRISPKKRQMLQYVICIPSMIYAAQNNLYYVALSNLDVAAYSVTSQLKIMATALFAVLILRKQLSKVQWLSLLLLSAGVALVQLEQQLQGKVPNPMTSSNSRQRPLVGLIAVLLSCLSSGFACVYFEKILKNSAASIPLQNVRLAAVGIPLSASLMIGQDFAAIRRHGIFHGFDALVWTLVVTGACGGFLIAAVMKYADNILKTYAQSLAIVFACVCSSGFFGFTPTVEFVAGTGLVIVSVVLYDRFSPAQSFKSTTKPA